MSRPTLSIVTVTIQPVSELKKTIDSLLSQRDAIINFEWILVVGRYYEDYQNYLQTLENKFDIKIFFQPPQGIYSAMNLGLSKSGGEWIWFVNCGDYLKDQHVITTVGKIIYENPSVGFIASPVLYATPQDFWFDVSWPRIVQVGTELQAHVHHQGVLVRKTICDKVDGGFDTSLHLAADGKFLDRAVSHTEHLIVDSIFCVFVMGGASAKSYIRTLRETSTYRKNGNLNMVMVVKNWFRQIILYLLERQGLMFVLRPFLRRRIHAVEKIIHQSWRE